MAANRVAQIVPFSHGISLLYRSPAGKQAESGWSGAPGPGHGISLGRVVMVVVMDMMVVMMFEGEGWTGKDHEEQDCGKNLFHGSNVARVRAGR
jgi:hypothetical protein